MRSELEHLVVGDVQMWEFFLEKSTFRSKLRINLTELLPDTQQMYQTSDTNLMNKYALTKA